MRRCRCGAGKECLPTSSLPDPQICDYPGYVNVSPVTPVGFYLGMHAVSGFDYYYISLAYGYNIPTLIALERGNGFYCSNMGCIVDLSEACSLELKVMSTGGEEVTCKSVFGDEQYYCSGAYNASIMCKLLGVIQKGVPTCLQLQL
ncbi:hypothetical protein LguiA_008077 [Lonicera macranthoides]